MGDGPGRWMVDGGRWAVGVGGGRVARAASQFTDWQPALHARFHSPACTYVEFSSRELFSLLTVADNFSCSGHLQLAREVPQSLNERAFIW